MGQAHLTNQPAWCFYLHPLTFLFPAPPPLFSSPAPPPHPPLVTCGALLSLQLPVVYTILKQVYVAVKTERAPDAEVEDFYISETGCVAGGEGWLPCAARIHVAAVIDPLIADPPSNSRRVPRVPIRVGPPPPPTHRRALARHLTASRTQCCLHRNSFPATTPPSSRRSEKKRFPSVYDAPSVTVSVVVPAYNEEARIDVMMNAMLEVLNKEAKKSKCVGVVSRAGVCNAHLAHREGRGGGGRLPVGRRVKWLERIAAPAIPNPQTPTLPALRPRSS